MHHQQLAMRAVFGLVLTALLAGANIGCAPEDVDVDQAVANAYEGKGIVVAETAHYVYIERRLEDLNRREQVDAYEFVLETVVDALQESDVTAVPGAETVLGKMSGIDISDTMAELEQDLAAYEQYIEDKLDVLAPSTSLAPSAVVAFLGMPISASAVVGGSGGVTAMIVMKLYKVTRISKKDGTIDDDWWRWSWDAEDAAILKVGLGFGAGGGVGVHGGFGLVWGELNRPEDFRGQSASLSFVPLAGGIGPILKAGVRWSNVTESADPDNFYVLAGVEAGATAKAWETHVQAGNVTGLWKWLAGTLGFDGITEGGDIDPKELE